MLADVRATSWWPTAVAPPDVTWFASSEVSMVELGSIATIGARYAPIPHGTLVVRPQDVDAVTGGIYAASQSDRDGLRLGDGLEVGDVLLPKVGSRPAVLVDERHASIAFSSGFLAIRPCDVEPLVLWSLLSSSSGIAARETWKQGSARNVVTATRLAAAPIPLLPKASQSAIAAILLLAGPLGGAVILAEEKMSTWGPSRLQPDGPWWPPALVARDRSGVAVSTVGQVGAGRVREDEAFAFPAVGRVPLIDAAVVRGRDRKPLWVAEADRALTSAQTILLTRTEPVQVLLAEPSHAVGSDLLRIDVNVEGQAAALAAFLAGSEGQQRLKSALSGVVVGRLTPSALADVRLPDDWISSPPADTAPLSSRLESILGSPEKWV